MWKRTSTGNEMIISLSPKVFSINYEKHVWLIVAYKLQKKTLCFSFLVRAIKNPYEIPGRIAIRWWFEPHKNIFHQVGLSTGKNNENTNKTIVALLLKLIWWLTALRVKWSNLPRWFNRFEALLGWGLYLAKAPNPIQKELITNPYSLSIPMVKGVLSLHLVCL